MANRCTLLVVVLMLAATTAACYVEAGPGPVAPPPPAPVVQTAPPPAPPPPPPVVVANPPPPPPSPTGGSSLGCFRDQGAPTGTAGRDLDGFAVSQPGMTTELCAQTCSNKGFPFAATQYSTWCFCGATYGKSGRADNCNMACAGNPNEMCGGAWANSVYQVRSSVAPPPPSPTGVSSLGCFRDQGAPTGTAGRDLNGLAVNQPGMTTELCAQTCSSKGFPFAATQYGTWCFCGATYGKSGHADNCNMACGGNPNEMCGGAWANSVYRVR